jgi:predicted alpha/beta hydrolase family esterase
MHSAIIVHGTTSERDFYDPATPSPSNSNWYPWLQTQLLAHGIQAVRPEMPLAFRPDYELWRREVERFDIGPETMLVGHSTGAALWLRYLSERPELHVGKVVLVAPWLDPNNIKHTDFFQFEFDPDLTSRTAGLTIFHSTNDHEGIQWSTQIICQVLRDWKFRKFEDYGHFLYTDMHTDAFPELLDELIGD